MPKTRGAETRQACSRFTSVNSREFVRISYEFHVNSREFIQILPLRTPSFVLTPGVPPPPMHPCRHPGYVQHVHMCVGVPLCGVCGFVWVCVWVYGCGCMWVDAGLPVCFYVRACVCVLVCVRMWGPPDHIRTQTRPKRHTNTHTPTHTTTDPWIHTHTQTRTQAHKPIHTHTHTHTHIDTPTMIPPHIPNHDTSTMQVCVRMCGWAVCGCGCGWGGRAASLH